MKKLILLITLFLISLSVQAQTARDQALIKEAISNYVEAFYQADTSKAYESIVKDLAKRGYYTSGGQVREAKMSFEQLVKLAQRWKNTQDLTAAPKKITVFEVLDKIATAKVEAKWGIDYFHLAKIDGKWMIINVLWQDYQAAK